MMSDKKEAVRKFWDTASCGEELYFKGKDDREKFENQLRIRYQLEPFILSFADFANSRGKSVLEIGVGLGADHQKFPENGAILTGIDLSPRAIQNTRSRMQFFGLTSDLEVADSENLPYPSSSFDIVYSYGVIHHTPNTEKAFQEIHRVLKPGGVARVMIYHKHSMVGYMLFLRYGFMKLRPFISMKEVYDNYMESPGTKAYTISEAKQLCKDFETVTIDIQLGHADLLTSEAGQRHRGLLLTIAKKLYPRKLIRKFFKHNGLFMLINLTKSQHESTEKN